MKLTREAQDAAQAALNREAQRLLDAGWRAREDGTLVPPQ